MVQKRDEEADKKKARTEWLLELMAEIDKLGGSNDEYWIWDDSNEEDEEGSDKEGEEEEDVEEKDEKEEVNADLGIVSIEGIAEHVMVKIGSLTVPTDFHIIRATRNSKGDTPQVLLGRHFLKTAGFQLDYITETFSFNVGNVEETFHPVRPPASFNKNAH
ncbi:hypothetical protein PIB30_042913 [Stylosanthes scabra]|uniref:Uncharacterized protein n=1 Tax=Stylosanthes scabra TaxID=79078 RepID=A0ABU6VDY1_9FABA|nr:hypothetical protein [Stylosanthes scabra]